jgi:quercetin dioxygenase-like cupin family protein
MNAPETAPPHGSAAKMVAYQPGAIVSRMVLKKDAGSVTLFAFDTGQELSEHTAPFDALVLVLEGRGQFRIEETSYVLEPGDTLLLPANRPHAVKAAERFKMMLVMIRSAS